MPADEPFVRATAKVEGDNLEIVIPISDIGELARSLIPAFTREGNSFQLTDEALFVAYVARFISRQQRTEPDSLSEWMSVTVCNTIRGAADVGGCGVHWRES